ncbi:MAG TPA: flagellar biosynthetic protein FliO [Pyrinomonadaceae bacterium]|nr:flagellar biosynthetic protein FliO [Pyrinomonadaceae bacterium]
MLPVQLTDLLTECASASARTHAFALMQDAGFGGGDAGAGGASLFVMVLQTIVALAFVCGLAYFIFRWLLPRLNVARAGGRMVRVVERAGLDARSQLYVIEVAWRWLLVSSSQAGVQLLSELDPKAAEDAAAEIEQSRPTFGADAAAVKSAFAERLARTLGRKGGR